MCFCLEAVPNADASVPSLSLELAKPFEPPTEQQPLRWRYTTYMGEWHPAEKKVVVEFCPDDLALTDVQRRKLTKLAGARYNVEKGTIKMSCESFEHPAQNKRYLSDLIAKLIAEAKVSLLLLNLHSGNSLMFGTRWALVGNH